MIVWNMNKDDKNRLRVESCIGAIIDVHRSISGDYENEEFISHFEELRRTVETLDMSLVSEVDIIMVETATNSLLGEFKPIFEGGDLGPVYSYAKN